MAKFALSGSTPHRALPAKPRDPREGVATPVRWHTGSAAGRPGLDPDEPAADLPFADALPDEPPADSVLWRWAKRTLLFWRPPTDAVRVSVFGPTAVAPGQEARLSVFVHTADAARSVRTLSRAFHHDSELIGSGWVPREVARGAELAVHLAVANAGVSRSTIGFVWRGQPQRLVFDLHVPWESPGGPAPGVVAVDRGTARIGEVAFRLTLLPRKG